MVKNYSFIYILLISPLFCKDVGVKCAQPNFEIYGSGMISSTVTFSCTSKSSSSRQFYAVFHKGEVKICNLFANKDFDPEINPAYINRTTSSLEKLPGSNASYNYTLVLNALQCSDEGEYSCAIADIDSAGGPPVKTYKNLIVNSKPQKPTLTEPPEPVVLGDVLTLECAANVGKPPRNLSLCLQRGTGSNCTESFKPVDLGNCSYTQNTSMSFEITENTIGASCKVLPHDEKLKVDRNWEVLFPILAIKLNPDDSPIQLTQGESKTISCDARGKPLPTFRWDFQPTNGDAKTLDGTDKDLSLANVGLDQSGIYTCIASNEIRNVTHNMTKSIRVNIVPTTPAPTTTTTTSAPETTSPGANGTNNNQRSVKSGNDDDWKLIVGVVCAVLFLLILIVLLVVLYRQRSKPAEIEGHEAGYLHAVVQRPGEGQTAQSIYDEIKDVPEGSEHEAGYLHAVVQRPGHEAGYLHAVPRRPGHEAGYLHAVPRRPAEGETHIYDEIKDVPESLV